MRRLIELGFVSPYRSDDHLPWIIVWPGDITIAGTGAPAPAGDGHEHRRIQENRHVVRHDHGSRTRPSAV